MTPSGVRIRATNARRRISDSLLVLACATVLLVAAGLYLRTVGHGFVWDDLSILMANDSLGDWSKLGSNLAPGFFNEPSAGDLRDYWRPAVVLSHMADRALFGKAAWGPHLINTILHAATSVLVLLLCHAWTRNLHWSFVAGLLFAVHPVHVEVAAWVSGRSDLLLGLFFALSLWADALHAQTGRARWQMLCLVFFTLALLSKEAAVVLPALFGARVLIAPADWSPSPPGSRRVPSVVVGSLAVLLVFLWVRWGLLGAAVPDGIATSADRSSLFWTWWSAFFLYLKLLVWPAGLTILHSVEVISGFWDPRAWAGLLAFLGLGWVGWRIRRRAPGAAFGVAILLVGVAPLSNFLVPVSRQAGAEFPFAERFLYSPSLGFTLLAAWVLSVWLSSRLRNVARGSRHRRQASQTRRTLSDWATVTTSVLTFFLVVAMGARADARIRDWKSDLSLFEVTVRDSAGSYLAHLNYAVAQRDAATAEADSDTRSALLETARLHYLEAARLAPDNYRVHYDLGNLYRSTGRAKEAEAALRRALQLNPELHQARINLGTLLAQSGDLEGALGQFEAADRQLPEFIPAKVNRAHVLQMLGRPAEAIPLYEEALTLQPGLPAAIDGLERATATLSAGRE